jgi:hypothetical protein
MPLFIQSPTAYLLVSVLSALGFLQQLQLDKGFPCMLGMSQPGHGIPMYAGDVPAWTGYSHVHWGCPSLDKVFPCMLGMSQPV